MAKTARKHRKGIVSLADPSHEISADVARMIHDARIQAGLTQAELGRLIGTKQQAIARMEDPKYGAHSLKALQRIATALRLQLSITMNFGRESHNGGS